MPNIKPLVIRPREIRGTGLIDGQHRTEVLRRFLTPAVVRLSDSDRRDQDANSSGVPDPKPSGPR